MRIGIMATPWVAVPPPAYGGSEVVIDQLARGFAAAGHEVLLWTTGDSTCPVPSGHRFETAQMDRIGMTSCEVEHLVNGYEAFHRWGADVVHDHTVIGPLFARRRQDHRIVTTNHGPFSAEQASLYRAVAGEVPVVAISRDQAARAPVGVVSTVIHHGIDVDTVPMGHGAGDGHGRYFAFLGRMAPDKGVHRAIVAARAAEVRLLIAAKMREPGEHAYFDEVIRPLLGDGIEYVGEVAARDKSAFLGGATALVNPIAWPEPFGLVMVEALACGTPVVACPVGSAPELIDDGLTGFLVPDPADLPERLLAAGTLERAECRLAAQRRFSSDRMVREHLEFFDQVLDDPHIPSSAAPAAMAETAS